MEQFEDEAGMPTKEEGVLELDYVALKSRVFDKGVLEYFNFHFGLSGKLRLVSDNFHRT